MRSFLSDSSRDEYGWGWKDKNSAVTPNFRSSYAPFSPQNEPGPTLPAKEFSGLEQRLRKKLSEFDFTGKPYTKLFSELGGGGQTLVVREKPEDDKAPEKSVRKISVKVEPSFLKVMSDDVELLYIQFSGDYVYPEVRPRDKRIAIAIYRDAFTALKKSEKTLFQQIGTAVLEGLPQ